MLSAREKENPMTTEAKVKHTPNWRAVDRTDTPGTQGESYFYIEGGCGYYKKGGDQGFCLSGYIKKSDAVLMAAAPKLLSALRDLVRQVEISNAIDDHGHALIHLQALKDAETVIAEADYRKLEDESE